MDPRLIYAFLAAIAIEILFPLALGLWLQNRLRTPWRLFGYGALVFLLSQLLTRIPALQVLQYLLRDRLAGNDGLQIALIAFAAVTAGLFEEGGRYLGYRFLWKRDDKTWKNSLMYGAGHGGLESMLLVGGLVILSLIGNLALMQMDLSVLTPEQVETAQEARKLLGEAAWWMPLLGAAERIMTIAIQISLSVMVLQVFTRKRAFWWWLALGYHTLVDLSIILLRYITPLQMEGVILIFALFSVGIILWLRPKTPPDPPIS